MLFTKKQHKEFLQQNNYKGAYYGTGFLEFYINENSEVRASVLEYEKDKGVTKIIISLHVGKKRVSGYFNTTLDTWKKEENKAKWIDYLYKHCMLEEVR